MPLFELEGKAPIVPESAFVAESAELIGDITLGEEVSVWSKCVIRGDSDPITIGQSSNVQESCVLHADPGYPLTLGERVSIGHMVMLHGCTIGDGCLVGIGATILNGAVIGENCLVGAGALVTENKAFPPNSMILGSPAKVTQNPISKARTQMMQGVAEHYMQNGRRFKRGLHRL
eukprot:SAG22_NODE_1128_length_5460_cov_15.018280_4_plen_175_part_00